MIEIGVNLAETLREFFNIIGMLVMILGFGYLILR